MLRYGGFNSLFGGETPIEQIESDEELAKELQDRYNSGDESVKHGDSPELSEILIQERVNEEQREKRRQLMDLYKRESEREKEVARQEREKMEKEHEELEKERKASEKARSDRDEAIRRAERETLNRKNAEESLHKERPRNYDYGKEHRLRLLGLNLLPSY